MITLTSDVADLILQRTLGENSLGLNNSINRMTTGYKVNQAKDNAAGYSIITDLSKKISSMLQVQQNTEDGIALLQTAEGGLEEVQKLLERLRDLATQASNGTYDAETREAMQAEADQILEQISQIRESIQYDNQNLYYRENNGNTTKTKSDDTISKNPAGRAAALSGATHVAQLSDDQSIITSHFSNALSSSKSTTTLLEGAEAFAGGETRTITIDGVQYTVKNKLTTANDLSYSKDTSTGELTLIASNFEIRGQEDVSHNIIISGRSNKVYGGKLSDSIQESALRGNTNEFHGGDGDDILILRSSNSLSYGEAGNDILTSYGVANHLFGGDGDDVFNTYASSIRSYGGAGNDIFNIDAVSNYVYGEDGDDSFNIISGTKHTIDGGGGTNNVTGNKDGNTLVNVIGANAFSEAFAAHETKTLTIDGKEYIITNGARAQSLNYKITTSGEIEFSSTIQAAISIKGQVDKSHNVRLSATAITFYGGDMSDIIRSSAGGCVIYAGGGDDIISGVSVDTIYAQSGNNIINAGNYGRVYGGTGKDTITLASYNQVIDASGGCEIIANGHNNTIACLLYTSDAADD